MELYNIYCGFFLERMKKNKCGGVPKWLYMVGNLKNKVDCSKRPSGKINLKKNDLKQKQKEKKIEERKEVEVQFELYCVKLVELVLIEKKKKIVLH